MLDKIPQELQLSIFGFLSYEDIKALRQTCKNFYYASLASCFIKNERIHFDGRMLKQNGISIVESLRKTDRIFYHISISDINQHDYFWVFSKFGSWLKTISFTKCSLEFLQFAYVVETEKFENLEKLRFSNCANVLLEGTAFIPDLESPKLSTVKSLEICNTSYLTDEALHRFCNICPNIEHLSIEATTLNCHPGVYQFNYKSNTNILAKPSVNVLTIQFVKALIHSKRNQITSLNFANTIINNTALTELMKIDDLKLKRLNLNYCRELQQTNVVSLGYWQPNITELQLAACDLVTNNFLVHISLAMPNLKILNISDNDNISDLGFKYIGTLGNIVELNISNCVNINSGIMVDVLCTTTMAATLKILKINQMRINEDDFMRLAYSLQLTELEISFCNLLMNYALCNIFISQKSLKRLEMSNIKVTDSGLTGVDNSKLRLPDIDLIKYKSRQISSSVVQEDIYSESIFLYTAITSCLNRSIYCLEDLAFLESLNISRCYVLSDLLFSIPMHLENLKELSLSGLMKITSKSMLFLPHNYPNLEILDISDTFVDDIGICVVVRKLHHLKNLNLKNTKISNVSLLYIIQHCKQLKILNIHGCWDLSDEILEQVKSLPTMIKIVGRPAKKIETNIPPIPEPPANM